MADKSGNKIIEVFDRSYDKQVIDVALNLRVEDFDEVFALHGESPHYALLESWKMSTRRWVILNKMGGAVAVLGVRPVDMFGDEGIPWLLGTDGLDRMKKFFVKISKPIIEEMKQGFKVLANHVDARYIKTVSWLEWCGFEIEEPEPYGVMGLPFHRFSMEIN
jgi:hypothetical protein